MTDITDPDHPDFVDPYGAEKDPLGARMKAEYEAKTRQYLPRRSISAVRVDGRSFHTFTRGLERPYDEGLLSALGETMALLAAEIAGCELGYHQSDEVSLLLTDFATETTEPWFGGSVQKMASVAASLATAYFNDVYKHPGHGKPAVFDARVFSLPSQVEAANYLLWRQQDARRNAVSMIGQAHFSQRELQGVSTAALKEKLAERGVDVDAFPEAFLRGQVAERVTVLREVEYFDKRLQRTVTTDPVERRVWELKPAPDFRGLEWLRERIPEPPAPELAPLEPSQSL